MKIDRIDPALQRYISAEFLKELDEAPIPEFKPPEFKPPQNMEPADWVIKQLKDAYNRTEIMELSLRALQKSLSKTIEYLEKAKEGRREN